MTPDERAHLAAARFTLLSAMRAGGVAVMLLGLWIWHGDVVRAGGWPAVGLPLFLLGMGQSLLLPKYLARRWRTPPDS